MPANNILDGGGGADTLIGLGGDDTMDGDPERTGQSSGGAFGLYAYAA